MRLVPSARAASRTARWVALFDGGARTVPSTSAGSTNLVGNHPRDVLDGSARIDHQVGGFEVGALPLGQYLADAGNLRPSLEEGPFASSTLPFGGGRLVYPQQHDWPHALEQFDVARVQNGSAADGDDDLKPVAGGDNGGGYDDDDKGDKDDFKPIDFFIEWQN